MAVKFPSISKMPTVLQANVVRFATHVPIRNNNRKVVMVNIRRGVVIPTARQCLWKHTLVVIGPFLPKRYTPLFRMAAQVVCGFRKGRGGQVPRNLRWNLGRSRLALPGMMKVLWKTTIRRIPDTEGRQNPDPLTKLPVLCTATGS